MEGKPSTLYFYLFLFPGHFVEVHTMPMFTEEIHDHDGTVKEQSIVSAINSILTIYGLKETDYVFNEPYNNSSQPESTVGLKTPVNMGVDKRIFVEVEDERDPDNLTDRGYGYDFKPAFFFHPKSKVQLCPAHAKHDLSFQIRFRHESRPQCRKFLNEIHRKASLQGDVFEVNIDYHYLIPPTVLSLLKATQEAYNVKLPVDQQEDLLDYLVNGFAPAVTVVTNSVGSGAHYAVRNTLVRVICRMEGPGDIRSEKPNDTGVWEANISFKLQIEWPEAVTAHYPAMFNNTLIGEDWWQEFEAPGISDDNALRDVYIMSQDKISQRCPTLLLPIYMPPVDAPEVEKGTRDPGELSMVIGYLEMDGNSPSPIHMFNLTQLGEVSFSKHTIDYLYDAFAKNQDGRDSVYRVFAYDGRNQYSPKNVGVTPALDAYLLADVKVERTYLFAISCRTDWSYLTEEGKEIIKKHPDVIIDIIIEFRPDLIIKYPELFVPRKEWPGGDGFPWPGPPDGNSGIDWGDIDDETLDKIIDELVRPDKDKDGDGGESGKNYYRSMLTILNGRIIARNM